MAQITTVIPTYRRPKLLRRAIRSVLAQTYPDFEVHVWDNASGDETAEVVAEFARRDPRVHYHCHPENIGMVGNFMCGMEKVATPYFHLLSDDDLVFPRFFEHAMAMITAHPEAIFFAGATIQASPEGDVSDVPIGRWRDGVYQPPGGLYEIIRNGHPDVTGTLFRREVLEKIGKLDGDVVNASDLDFFCRCAAQSPIAVSTAPCAAVIQHSASAGILAAEKDPYGPAPVAAYWLKIAANIESLNAVPEADRRRAKALIIAGVRKRLFLRGCKAAVAGRDAQARETIRLLRTLSGGAAAPLAIRLLGYAAKGPLGGGLKSAAESARALWARRIRNSLNRKQVPAYGAAVRNALAKFESPRTSGFESFS